MQVYGSFHIALFSNLLRIICHRNTRHVSSWASCKIAFLKLVSFCQFASRSAPETLPSVSLPNLRITFFIAQYNPRIEYVMLAVCKRRYIRILIPYVPRMSLLASSRTSLHFTFHSTFVICSHKMCLHLSQK
jgi:hypothetical protein